MRRFVNGQSKVGNALYNTCMQTPLGPGTFIDRYELIQEIGRGGMGIVYRAEDAQLQRSVAIKLLAPHLGQDATALTRFQREAAMIARLKHPHIATVYDFGQHDAYPYIAMEWVEGITLKEVLGQNRQMALDACLRLADQLASALDYAHQQGVIHRDLKPANIIVNPQGQATIVDFGLARLESAPAVTATGDILGTPRYMAPEQIQDLPVDGRADQYSLATILYEALAGSPVFNGETTPALLQQQLYIAPTAVTEHNPTVPEAVSIALDQALAKAPENRFASVRDFSQSMRGVAPAMKLAPPTQSQSDLRWQRLFIPLIAILGVIGVVLAAQTLNFGDLSTTTPSTNAENAPEEIVDAEESERPLEGPSWVEGWRMTGGDLEQRNFIYTMLFPMNAEARWEYELGEALAQPMLATSGTLIATGVEGAVAAVDWATGEEIWRTSVSNGFSAEPLLTFGDETEYVVVATDADGIYAFTRWEGILKWRINPDEFEDGTIIALVPTNDDRVLAVNENGTLHFIDLDAGEIEPILEVDTLHLPPATSNTGVFIATDERFIVAIDVNTGDIVWERDLEESVTAGPLVFEDTGQLFVGTESNIQVITMLSGEVVESYPADAPVTSLSANWSKVFVTTNTNVLGAIDPYSAELVWDTDFESTILGQPTVLEETIIVTTTDSDVHVLNTENGQRRDDLSLFTDIVPTTSVRPVGGWMFMQDTEIIYAFGPEE